MYGEGEVCDQEGCCERSAVTYKLKRRFWDDGNISGAFSEDANLEDQRPLTRKFCQTHSTRGNCSRDDGKKNYEVLEGEATAPRKEFISKSVLGGVVFMGEFKVERHLK
jgi:hypothetical protein